MSDPFRTERSVDDTTGPEDDMMADLQGLPGDLAESLMEKARALDDSARRQQSWRSRVALFTAMLGPVAVLLLAIQVVAFPHGTTWAAPLVAGELLALLLALMFSSLELSESHGRWLRNRQRAELLRREHFLLRTGVGPYLGPSDLTIHDVDQRLLELESEENDPADWLELGDPEHGDWRSQLEDAWQRGQPISAPDLFDSLPYYLTSRVRDQRSWFNERSERHAKSARRGENFGKLVLVLAFGMAVWHLTSLAAPPKDPKDSGWHWEMAILIAAIALPALGTAIGSLLAIRGSARLKHAYRQNARRLQAIERQLLELQEEMQEAVVPQSPEDLAIRFKRLVLRAEDVLSDDLRQWWQIMKPEAPRPAA